tara:strand:+ start:127 stop:1275 length:1149 start_codon:yes stop_codon:yes gene_type:complete
VSSFVSGEREVDMNFRNALLPKSADHFKVGIDELTINLSALSLLEYTEDEVVFRVIRRGYQAVGLAQEVPEYQGTMEDFQMPNGPAGDLNKWRSAFEFKVVRPYNTMLEVMERCTEVANAVGTFIRSQGLVNVSPGNQYWTIPWAVDPANANLQHFEINITRNGQIRFSGNKIFWANFAIEVPFEKYRQILFRDPDKRFISIDPFTGAEIEEPYQYSDALDLWFTHVFDDLDVNAYGDPTLVREHEFSGDGNLLASLDRRVTLEVGCSLPIKNSPMIDHGEEAPDFVLGRYMFHQPYTMVGASQTVPELLVPGLGTRTMQGPKDRIVYHHLQPQQKIQVLRLRLWARVRSYNTTTKKWGMKTILCPVEDIDYWHIRLHFTEK